MALTLTKEITMPWGADRIYRCRATFTSVTTGTVVTGMGDVHNLQYTNLTDNSRAVVADVTTTLGSIAFSAVTAGDVIDIVAVGPK